MDTELDAFYVMYMQRTNRELASTEALGVIRLGDVSRRDWGFLLMQGVTLRRCVYYLSHRLSRHHLLFSGPK